MKECPYHEGMARRQGVAYHEEGVLRRLRKVAGGPSRLRRNLGHGDREHGPFEERPTG